jgi:hypothetical protein
LYLRPGTWYVDEICSGALTLKDAIKAFPDTVQVGVAEKKFGLLASREQAGGDEVKVLLRVAVTVTHVPGGPRSGRKARLDTVMSYVPP